MTGYDVTVFREDDLWVADVGGVGATDMVRFGDLELGVRDYIAGMTDTEPGAFDLSWHYRAGEDDVTELIGALGDAEATIARAAHRRDTLRREIIRRMSAGGLSQRAIGDVLGLSHQRVHQLSTAM